MKTDFDTKYLNKYGYVIKSTTLTPPPQVKDNHTVLPSEPRHSPIIDIRFKAPELQY